MKYVSQKHFFYRLKTYSVKKIVTPKPALASCPANVCESYNSISLSFTYTGVNILMHNKGDYHKENALKHLQWSVKYNINILKQEKYSIFLEVLLSDCTNRYYM